ncbi:hypothetical protein KIPB_006654 [Kipferlia bialata]|uniref:Flavin reductase like domain-containing protein n=1 Tax=Kipferlia bialata TaxID=797122 RepID=A0A9K3CXC5_9EUKA|nr:hypothetical protein KIPB_006654 [Kipferlia bialata]|eukprot:g6654.t1
MDMRKPSSLLGSKSGSRPGLGGLMFPKPAGQSNGLTRQKAERFKPDDFSLPVLVEENADGTGAPEHFQMLLTLYRQVDFSIAWSARDISRIPLVLSHNVVLSDDEMSYSESDTGSVSSEGDRSHDDATGDAGRDQGHELSSSDESSADDTGIPSYLAAAPMHTRTDEHNVDDDDEYSSHFVALPRNVLPCSLDPGYVCFSISNGRRILDCLREQPEVTITYVSLQEMDADRFMQLQALNEHIDDQINILHEFDLSTIRAQHVQAPIISPADVAFEGRVEEFIPVADHTLCIVKICASYVNRNVVPKGKDKRSRGFSIAL